MSVIEAEIEFEVGPGNARPTPFTSDTLKKGCDPGYVMDSLGRCVPNPSPVQCNLGFENVKGGKGKGCVAITSEKARGKIVRVERPSTIDANSRFVINVVYKNLGSTTGRFGVHLRIPTLGNLDLLTDFHDVKAKEQGTIVVALEAHDLANEGTITHAGVAELVRALKDVKGVDKGLATDSTVRFSFNVIKFSGPR